MRRFASPDAVAFLLLESSRRPMHMAGLQFFTPPEGSGSDFGRATYEAMRACMDVAPMFAGHPVTMRGRSVVLGWTYDNAVDLDYHLQYTSLPAPGGTRELLETISRLHSQILDRRRPLWEVHVIDGFDDGRFAIFTKAHHALFDGVSFLQLLRRSLSTDPASLQIEVLWSQRPQVCPQSPGFEVQDKSARDRIIGAVKSVAEVGRSVTLVRAAVRERALFPVFDAPRTVFNGTSDVPWVCAAQAWPIHRINNVKDAAGATVNDVALAMCAGALRALLFERDALPDRPLVALVPVDLRTQNDPEGRNLMSSALCNLATHLEDPAERLRAIQASMRFNKRLLRELPRQAAMYLAGIIGAPIADSLRLTKFLPSQFNVGISHVADARETLYHNASRLDGTYGFPPTVPGHALNIGLASNAISLNVGIVGSARLGPNHDRLLDLLEVSLRDLERAVGP